MNISEMTSSITRTIKNRYPEVTIYKEKIEQGFKMPCFFVTCLNADQKKVGKLKYDREYLFNIRYHIKNPERIELLTKGEELQEELQEVRKDNELLMAKELKYEIVEDVLQFFASYKQGFINIDKQGPLMNELDIKEGVN